MPQKPSKNKSPISRGKQEISHKSVPWPNLPHQIIPLLAKQPNLMQRITSFGCVAKSWRQSPKQCNRFKGPRLVELDLKHRHTTEKGSKMARSHIVEIAFHEEFPYCYYKRRSYNNYYCPGMYFKGLSHGRIVVVGADRSDLYLYEPTRQSTIYLPKWDPNLPFKTCILSSYPECITGCNIMAITGMSSPAFAFYRWGKDMNNTEWAVQNCTIKEPYAPSESMKFTNAIGCHGKFYGLSLQGSLVVIEDVNSSFTITAIGANRAIPSGLSRQFREYLVELHGDVLLVLLVSRKSVDLVEDVEVFRLDVEQLLWEKVGSIGDKALFVEDECCMGVTARNVGCKKNCIYFTHQRVDVWQKFDMESGKISAASGYDDGLQAFENWQEPVLDVERFKKVY